MPVSALVLALVAAVQHAAWNALAKRAADHTVFMWLVFTVAGTILAVPVMFWYCREGIPLSAMPFILASTAVHLAYIYLLGKSYEHGDYSMAYPILRGLGVALVPVIAVAAYGEILSIPGFAGIGCVVAGILLIGLTAADTPDKAAFWKRSLIWPALTGVSIAAYSLIDRGGVQFLHPLPYFGSFMVGSALLLIPAMLVFRQRVASECRLNWKPLVACGVLAIASYLLVLHAFRLAPTGYVVATRESSVVFSVLIGGLLLYEYGMKLRLAATGLIFAGVCLIAFWG